MRKAVSVALVVLMVFMLAACAPGPNSLKNSANEEGKIAGFWNGLWHGSISFVTFVISLFNDDVSVYEVRNNGGWYNFGFILGIMIVYGGSSGGASRSKRKKDWDD